MGGEDPSTEGGAAAGTGGFAGYGDIQARVDSLNRAQQQKQHNQQVAIVLEVERACRGGRFSQALATLDRAAETGQLRTAMYIRVRHRWII